MKRIGRATAAIAVLGFGYLIYLYLTLPDVRELRTRNPGTTAFIELRAREARAEGREPKRVQQWIDRKSTRLNSSHTVISYAVFCLKKKNCRTYCHCSRLSS